MEEIWKDVSEYEGLYQVSNYGRVKSLHGKEKILKPHTDSTGYVKLWLYKDGNKKMYSAHRLVLMTFNPIANMEQLEVDHINTIRTDNRLENLRWCTKKENHNNPLTRLHNSESLKGENNPMYGKHHKEESIKKMSDAKKGKSLSEEHRKNIGESNKGKHKGENNPNYGKFGAKHQRSIPIVQLTLGGKLVEVYGSTCEAERNGFNKSHINQCVKGKRNKHGGYKWLYLHEYLLLKHPKITELNLFGKSYNRKEVNN